MLAQPRILTTLANSLLGRKIVAEDAASRLEDRRNLVAEIQKLREDSERSAGATNRELEQLRATREKAEEALKVAQARESDALGRLASISSSVQRGIWRCEQELRTTADPSIDQVLTWLMQCFVQGREVTPDYEPVTQPGGHQIVRVVPGTGLDTVLAAQREAEALKLEALDQLTLERRIAEIVGSVPSKYAKRAGV